MRTGFTAEQLAKPGLADAEQAIRGCVHCGMCNATCPTYLVAGDERDGPRGRIQLMQAMLEKGGAPDEVAVRHVDRCLSCLACRTTCPSGVDYARLVDEARIHIAEHYTRPRDERWFRSFLARVLPFPRRMRWAMRLAPLSRTFAGLLPDAFKRMAALKPAHLSDVEPVSNGTHAAIGPRKMRVALLRGCVQNVLAPEIDRAAVDLLTRMGVEVVIPPSSGCCGALNHHLGHESSARRFARANVAAWWKLHENGGLDRIVATASGCGAQVKDYAHLLGRDAGFAFRTKKLVPVVRDIAELLAELGYRGRAPEALKVAYHAPCSLQHGQRVVGVGEALLRAAGFELVPVRDPHLCCGSAGHYSLLQPQMADELRRRKVATLTERSPDVIATANIGCLDHMRRGTATPVVHAVQLLEWAAGGGKPAALAARRFDSPGAPPDGG